jgi:hypothetical protein
MEPSAQVWQNIDAELDGKKRSKGMFPWLSIAASIIILIAAAVLFIPKKEIEDKHHPKNNKLTTVKIKPAVTEPVKGDKPVIQAPKDEQIAVVKTPVGYAAKAHPAKQVITQVVQQKEDIQTIAKTEPVKTEEQPVLAVTAPKKTDENINPIAANEPPLVIKKADVSENQDLQSQPVVTTTQPVLAGTQLPAAKTNKPAPRKHIHNFGDLVNLVVAKVDKRKDKLIEFTDTDDDESMITGVHIGSVKIKKDN